MLDNQGFLKARTWLRLAACAACLALAPAAVAQDSAEPADPRIDADTGRDMRTWPRSPLFDFKHMRLEIDIPTMSEAKLSAVETLRVAPLGKARSQLVLDCRGPQVRSVTRDGKPVAFEQDGGKLTLTFAEPSAPNAEFEVKIAYDLDFAANRGAGLTWSAPKPDAASLTLQSPQIHSQGEAELNSRWFPCHDFPNEKLTTELVVTVEDGFEVCSNGHLVSREAASPGRVRWHWLQDKPHATYLVALVVARFAVVDVGGPQSARPGLPINVYAPFGSEERVKESFSRTPDMIAFFEQKFAQPYPWDKYSQLICRDFVFGGMENTSATILYSQAASAEDQDSLISHELAHQWFGDLVTCDGWAHLWLNEGWASMCEALWAEARAAKESPEKARKAYQSTMLRFIQTQRFMNHAYAPQAPAMVSYQYRSPESTISKSDDVYSKGAMILHMLRTRLGDDIFTAGTRLYLERHKFGFVRTEDFRRALEEVSGQSLERFFDQWALRPGLPKLEIDLEFSEADSTLNVTLEQTQRIDRLNPAYAFSLPLYVKFEGQPARYIYVETDQRSVTAAFKLPAKPTQVVVDPNLSVLASNNVRKPLAMWLDQLREGPTLFAQAAAIRALATIDDAQAREALASFAAANTDPALAAICNEQNTRYARTDHQ